MFRGEGGSGREGGSRWRHFLRDRANILVQARNIMDCLPKSMPAHVPRGLRQVWELAAARFALFNMLDIAL